MDEIRLGTVGTGSIVRKILNNVALFDGISLQAVYSRSEEKGNALAAEFGCQTVYTDLDALLADESVNTVYIASPNLLHYEQAKRALLAGKHVICEKPFVTRSCDAEALFKLAKEKRLFLVEAAPTLYLPNFEILKRELPKIGSVTRVESDYSKYSSRFDNVLRGEKPNIFNPEFGGGSLMDINFYNVLLNIALFGEPNTAKYEASIYPGLADTSGVFTMVYDGFTSVNIGAKDKTEECFFRIDGRDGSIFIENGSNGLQSIRVKTKDGEETLNHQPNTNRWYYEIEALTKLMREGAYDTIYGHLETTLAAVRVMEKARKEAGILFPGDEIK